ncbi:MAG TPA: SelL-related redox protein [Candidatus Binatia bacterium]
MPCQAHLVEVNAFKREFDRRDVKVVVVAFSEPTTLVHYQEHHQWHFPILADPERKAYQAFGLERLSWHRVYSLATLKLYLKLFRKGLVRQDYGESDVYQTGGDFLIDRNGKILFAHRSDEPADRPSVSTLLKAIDRNPGAASPGEN